ncbi:MAG: hypothetical protein V1918_04465, partial [Planctomycetota bacterium]
GYNPSWIPITLAWIALAAHLRKPGWGSAVLYSACAVTAVGILPMTIFPFGVLALWAVLVSLPGRPWRHPALVLRLFWIGAIPFAGLAWYLGDFSSFLRHAKVIESTLTTSGLLYEWLNATRRDIWWLLPFAGAGLVFLAREARRDASWSPASPRGRLLFVIACLAGPPVFLGLMPRAPFTRHLVPLLPLWYGGLGILMASFVRILLRWRPMVARAVQVLLLVLLFATATVREQDEAGYLRHHTDEEKPIDLYYQYFHHAFHPSVVVEILNEIALQQPTAVFMDDSDLWSTRWILKEHYRGRLGSGGEGAAYFLYYQDSKLTKGVLPTLVQGRRVLLLTRSAALAKKMRDELYALGEGAVPLSEPKILLSTGYFKIFDCPPQVQPSALP